MLDPKVFSLGGGGCVGTSRQRYGGFMDTAGTGNKGSGSAADDLWKKVLKDVSTEAAQRRQKIAARTVSAVAKVAPGDSELLKRVLLALEAKPNGEANAQIEAILKKLLEAVTALPREVPDHSDKLSDHRLY